MIELRPYQTFFDVYPHPRILLPNHWVKFSDGFPEQLSYVKGKTMRIDKQAQVTYELSYKLKEACYKDINLSNEDTGVKLYPDSSENLYELIIGLKPGNYYMIPYFPADIPIYRLDYPTMTPLVSDSSLKYLGNVKPSDSPAENPTLKLYLVYQLKPIILRLVSDDGVDYEKCTLQFTVNRCRMVSGTPPENVTPKPIYYLDELKF